MKISDLIAELERVRATHGDVPVLVAGFDSWGFDEVRSIKVMRVAPVEKKSHGPDFEAVEKDGSLPSRATGEAFIAISMDPF
ncbi:MAG: hypothetical protein PW999_07930 [Paraburkholderia tropica]|nr:hypothetical protein [Paraburkholderia tropica]